MKYRRTKKHYWITEKKLPYTFLCVWRIHIINASYIIVLLFNQSNFFYPRNDLLVLVYSNTYVQTVKRNFFTTYEGNKYKILFSLVLLRVTICIIINNFLFHKFFIRKRNTRLLLFFFASQQRQAHSSEFIRRDYCLVHIGASNILWNILLTMQVFTGLNWLGKFTNSQQLVYISK